MRFGARSAIAALAVASALSGCSGSTTSDGTSGTSVANSSATTTTAPRATKVVPALTATGPHGEKVTLAKVPERIVCITGICDDITAALEITPVGTTTPGVAALDFEFGSAAKDIPVVPGSFGSEDVESIARLKPDLVIGLGGAHEALAPALSKFTTLLIVDPQTYQDSVAYLRMVATLADRPEQQVAAEQAFLDSLAETRAAAAAGRSKPRVLAMWGGTDGFGVETSPGSVTGSVLAEVFDYPFATLSSDPVKAGAYSMEQILEKDPQVIFVSSMTFSPDDPQATTLFAANPLWQKISAVEHHQAYEVDMNIWQFCRGTGCMVEVLEQATPKVVAAKTA
jgi:iron complex transport system substrate-binding protein